MTDRELLNDFLSLPVEAQNQVLSLIASLKQKYLSVDSPSPSSSIDLMNEDFIGMWKDRQDLASSTWVRDRRS